MPLSKMSEKFEVSVIDFEQLSIDKHENIVSKENYNNLATEIWKGLTEVGFLFLKNHGIEESQILFSNFRMMSKTNIW